MKREPESMLRRDLTKYDRLGDRPMEAFNSCSSGEFQQVINSLLEISGKQSLVNCRWILLSIRSYIPENKRHFFKRMWQRCDVEDNFGVWNLHYRNRFYRFSQINQNTLIKTMKVVNVAVSALAKHFVRQIINPRQQRVYYVDPSSIVTRLPFLCDLQSLLGLSIGNVKSPKNRSDRPYSLNPSRPIGLREFVVVSQNDDIDNAKNYQKCDREVGVFHALTESCLKGILA